MKVDCDNCEAKVEIGGVWQRDTKYYCKCCQRTHVKKRTLPDALERIRSLEDQLVNLERLHSKAEKTCLHNKLCWFCGGDVYGIKGRDHLICDSCDSTYNNGN